VSPFDFLLLITFGPVLVAALLIGFGLWFWLTRDSRAARRDMRHWD
jgi:hypothetical protein